MTRHSRVVNALSWLRIAGKAVKLAERTKLVFTSGQNFVNIALMTDVENNPVLFGVEYAVKRERKLNRSKV